MTTAEERKRLAGAVIATALAMEVLASQYVAALTIGAALAIGEPKKLTKKQMKDVLDKMSAGAGYGSS